MRREVLTILAITTLVIALVAIFGPSMTEISTTEPTRAKSIPITSRDPEWGTHTEPTPEEPPQLAFEIRDAVTGARIEADTAVELTRESGAFFDIERGRANDEAIAFDATPDEPLFARVRRVGYVDAQAGPIAATAAPQTVRVQLAPLYVVTIKPVGEHLTAVRVFSELPPESPRLQPYSLWEPLRSNSATFLLTPGNYWCQVPRWDPRKHFDHRGREDWMTFDQLDRNPALWTDGCGMFVEFEVVDGPMTLQPQVIWPEGTATISGILKSDDGYPRSDIGVVAVRQGPAFTGEVAASTSTTEGGLFSFKNLVPGSYLVQPHPLNAPHQPGAFVAVDLVDTATVELVHGDEIAYASEKPPGRYKFTVVRDGEPVSNAVIAIWGYGRKASYFSPHTVRYLATTNAEGVAEGSFGFNYELILVVRSHSMKLFDTVIVPGGLTEQTLEITEAGTGMLDATFDIKNAQLRSFFLVESGDSWSPRITIDDPPAQIQICGLVPGKYRVVLRDGAWYDYSEEVEIKAGEELKLERTVTTHSLSVRWPALSKHYGYDFALLHNDEARAPDHRELFFSLHKKPHGIELPAVAEEPHRVALYFRDELIAVAHVARGQLEVAADAWVRMSAETPEAGGTVRFSAANRLSGLTGRVDMEISRSRDVSSIHFGDRYADHDYSTQRATCTFENLLAGVWHIRLIADDGEVWHGDVTIEAGKLLEVAIDMPAEPKDEDDMPDADESTETDSHDRPLDGLKIKLPKQTGPSEPPPLPSNGPTPPPPLPPVPFPRDSIGGGREFLYVDGATSAELWRAMVHLKGSGLGISARLLENTGGYRPYVALVRRNGRLALYVEGIEQWFTELTLQVPGFKNVVFTVTDGKDREIKLVRD